MPTIEELHEAAIRNIGRNPSWTEQDNADQQNRPNAASKGVYLEDSPKTLIGIALRAEVHRRAFVYSVTTFDAAATYTLTLNGTSVAVVAPASVDALLDSMKVAIDGDPTLSVLVSVTALDANGDDVSVSLLDTVSLLIQGKGFAHYSIVRSETGTGVCSAIADGETASAKVFLLAGGQASGSGQAVPPPWFLAEGAVFSVTDDNWIRRFDTAGLKRAAVQVYNLTGTSDVGVTYRVPDVHIGPAVDE